MADAQHTPAMRKTRWFPHSVKPVRVGTYECAVRITSSAPLILWMLEWDGSGFLVPCPMVVHHWRGLTKTSAERGRRIRAAMQQEQQ